MKLKFIPLCAIAAAMLASCAKTYNTELYQEIKSADKLVLASMAITKTATMESSGWYTVGKRIAVYSYDTYM
ncbi:MAG: hypothetical protein K2H98_01980, partial [Duncaniella sp.]|nr:hypothetical protein [Duncaniella sp.]